MGSGQYSKQIQQQQNQNSQAPGLPAVEQNNVAFGTRRRSCPKETALRISKQWTGSATRKKLLDYLCSPRASDRERLCLLEKRAQVQGPWGGPGGNRWPGRCAPVGRGARNSPCWAPRPCLSRPLCHHTHSSLVSLRSPAVWLEYPGNLPRPQSWLNPTWMMHFLPISLFFFFCYHPGCWPRSPIIPFLFKETAGRRSVHASAPAHPACAPGVSVASIELRMRWDPAGFAPSHQGRPEPWHTGSWKCSPPPTVGSPSCTGPPSSLLALRTYCVRALH